MTRTRTLFWAVALDPRDVLSIVDGIDLGGADDTNALQLRPEFHCTLLYVGRKVNKNAVAFADWRGRICNIIIDGIGRDANYLTLRVTRVADGDDDVPFFGTTRHVTVACAPGWRPAGSPAALDNIELLSEPVQLAGVVKEYV